MAEWRDKGILLKARPYGDSAWIVHFLTQDHGRFAGLVRGGQETKRQLQPGSTCDLQWVSRLEDQLGMFRVETEHAVAPRVLDDPLRLHALITTLNLLDKTLPEREPATGLFFATSVWTKLLEEQVWGETLVKLELGLLAYLGYGLELEKCAVTGATENLTSVSPRTGAAVCAEVAAPYAGKLLPLPAFLIDRSADGGVEAVIDGLNLTGYFLHNRVFAVTNTGLPSDRVKLVEKLNKAET
ncbi:MAG: DNA repair protein RecO [Alphaproteobacteria bacterium]